MSFDKNTFVSSPIAGAIISFLSKEKLVNEISITSKKDNVKNCFRVEGGDDYINAMVAVANVNGTNYITQFSNLQYEDMTEELKEVLQKYIQALF